MAFKVTDTNRVITIYNLSSATNEFIGKGDGFIPANTGLPAYSTDIAPPKVKAGFVAVFDIQTNKWSQVEDHGEKPFMTSAQVDPLLLRRWGPCLIMLYQWLPKGDMLNGTAHNRFMMQKRKKQTC